MTLFKSSEQLGNLLEYCEEHSSQVDVNLQELDRHTGLTTLAPQMLSGSLQGKFLEFMSVMNQPDYIVEIGAFTGYSAICLAKGMSPSAKLISFELNPELEKTILRFWDRYEFRNRMTLVIGDAMTQIPNLESGIDLVFIDADKVQYQSYYEALLPKLKSGGFIIADNTLWSGKVLNTKKDKETEALDVFNKHVVSDSRVEQILMPFRDGISLIRKL